MHVCYWTKLVVALSREQKDSANLDLKRSTVELWLLLLVKTRLDLTKELKCLQLKEVLRIRKQILESFKRSGKISVKGRKQDRNTVLQSAYYLLYLATSTCEIIGGNRDLALIKGKWIATAADVMDLQSPNTMRAY